MVPKNSVKIRIAMVEDHLSYRQGLRALLEEEQDFEIVMEMDSGEEIEERYNPDEVDIILLDLRLVGQSGAITCQNLYAKYEQVRIIVLSTDFDAELIIEMIKNGASAYLSKNDCISRIKYCLRYVFEHGHCFDLKLGEILRIDASKTYKKIRNGNAFCLAFSPQEVQIALLVFSEKSTEEIAEIMNLSTRTIEKYKESIRLRVERPSFMGVIRYMLKHGLIYA